MAPGSPPHHTTSSTTSPSLSRLQNIAKQMAPASTTSFPPEAVPQAPEDPLFGLMRAYKADTSPNKVDLVGLTPLTTPSRCCTYSLASHRESVPTETTTQSHGFSQLSKRFASSSCTRDCYRHLVPEAAMTGAWRKDPALSSAPLMF